MTEPNSGGPERKALRNAGELFTQCRERYGLTPDEVLGLLEFADAESMKTAVGPGTGFQGYDDIQETLEERLTLRSGRVLTPEAGPGALVEALEEAERRAWDCARRYRLQEFGHWAEQWASLNKVSGLKRRNPFGAVAALGRTHAKRGSG